MSNGTIKMVEEDKECNRITFTVLMHEGKRVE